jgi:hypothetical protein
LEEDDFEDIQALVLNLQSAISLKEASVEEAKAELEKWTNINKDIMHHEQSKSKCDGFQKKSPRLSVHRFEINILQDIPKRISSWGSRNDDKDNKIMPAMVTTIGDSSRSVNSNQLVTLNNEQWKKTMAQPTPEARSVLPEAVLSFICTNCTMDPILLQHVMDQE